MAKKAPRKAAPDLPARDEPARPWLASYPPGVPERYDYPLVPLTRLLDDAAKDFPHTTALEFLGNKLTYRELLDQVDRFATALHHLGVGRGDRVGIVLPNCPQHVIALFAALRLAAVAVEIDVAHAVEGLEHELNDAGCSVVVCADPVYPRLAALKGRLPAIEHVIATSLGDYQPFLRSRLFGLRHRNDPAAHYEIPAGEGVLRFTELVARTAPALVQAELDPADDLALLLYTAGTTGPSKGVMLTHLNLVANAFQARLWVPDVQAGRETIGCVLPLSHPFGLTICLTFGVLSAATLVLVPSADIGLVLRTVDKRKPTLLHGLPPLFVEIAEAADVAKHDLSSVRTCISAGAPLPVAVARRFEELTGGKLREGYGLTEATALTHANPVYGKAGRGSVGLPLTDTVCTLVALDDPARLAPPGGPGELAISGPQVMQGYWGRPEDTASVLRGEWLLTGDVAAMDEAGYFTIVDRKTDVVSADGQPVFPREVEQTLATHPKVARAAVVGRRAFVVLAEGENATIDELDSYLRDRLDPVKVPEGYEFTDDLPETPAGAVLRRALAAGAGRGRR